MSPRYPCFHSQNLLYNLFKKCYVELLCLSMFGLTMNWVTDSSWSSSKPQLQGTWYQLPLALDNLVKGVLNGISYTHAASLLSNTLSELWDCISILSSKLVLNNCRSRKQRTLQLTLQLLTQPFCADLNEPPFFLGFPLPCLFKRGLCILGCKPENLCVLLSSSSNIHAKHGFKLCHSAQESLNAQSQHRK